MMMELPHHGRGGKPFSPTGKPKGHKSEQLVSNLALQAMRFYAPSSPIPTLHRLRFMLIKLALKNRFHLLKAISTIIVFVIIFLLLQSNFRHVPGDFPSSTHVSYVNGEAILSHPFASNIIVSELNRFVFCPIPKAASSNWKYLIRKFEGFQDYADLTKAHHHNISGLRYLSDYSPLEVQRILTDQTFFKFVFVRNPFKRVASCYMDKFLNNDPNYVHSEYRSFLAQLFSWHYARDVDIDHQPRPSFHSFIDELTKQQPAAMNAHWMPQTIHCGFGLIPYDFIGRMEHLDTHVTHVLKAIGKTEHRFPTQEDIGFLPSGTTRSAIATLYNPDVIAKVRALYDMDFHYLGYDRCDGKTDNIDCIYK